jgi:hypothetical protein
MYRVFRNNRPAGNIKFATYEAARQWLRKKLRDLTAARYQGQPSLPASLFGYQIRKFKTEQSCQQF